MEKVSKTTFTVLLEYLEGLQGQTTINRVMQDATRRALRYKAWLKGQERQSSNEADKTDEFKERNGIDVQEDKESPGTRADALLSVEEQKHDALRWNALGEHDKRKEYKRARKILDTLRALQKQHQQPKTK